MEVEFSVLGELRVVVGGADVTPRAPREKALLGLLAVHRGRVVAADRLAEVLWGDLPPAQGRRALQVRVAAVRKHLGHAGAGALLESVPPGYRLRLDAGALDVDLFDELVADGSAAALRRALDLWRGDAYADAQGCTAVEVEAARLEERRLAAVEAWASAELALGHHLRLVAELEALVAEHPLRERLWEQLVVALYRSGRQADALRAGATIRARLRDELGVLPGAALRALEADVLGQAPALDWSPLAATPPVVPLRSPPPATAIPGGGPLVGRAADLARVLAMVRGHRVVTITGPGGIGKTRLARAVAHAAAEDRRDGAWMVELAPIADPSALVAAVAGALPLPAMAASASELAVGIGARQVLLVLDSCEHLVDEVAQLVARLVPVCPGLRVLCTSQEALAIELEQVWPLRPLAPGAARALFELRAQAVRPDAVHPPEAVATIVERLEGLPLAIELAAGRVTTASAEEIAAHLDDRFSLLSSGLRDAPPRHRGLRAMVDWSHELLEAGHRRAFRRLAVFPGAFTRAAAVEVVGIEAEARHSAAQDLDHLVRRSLVAADPEADGTRYRLAETLRQYGRDRLVEAGEDDVVGRRHAEWCATRALGFTAVHSVDEAAQLAAGLSELDGFRAAVAYALEHGEVDLAVRLVGPLWPLISLWRVELLTWARQVIALPGADRHPGIGYVHVVVAGLTGDSSVTPQREECERACDEALRHPLVEDAWTVAVVVKSSVLAYRGQWEACNAVRAAALRTVTSTVNRTLLEGVMLATEGYTGEPSGIDPSRLVSSADAVGRPGLRAFARSMAAIALVGRGRATEATILAREAVAVAPRVHRTFTNVAHEVLALAEGAGVEAGGDELAVRAARALDLTREYPLSMGFALIGLVVHAGSQGREQDAALLAGYLSANRDALSLPDRSVEGLAGGPLERFVTVAARPAFERGRAMDPAGLDAVLAHLAGGGRC